MIAICPKCSGGRIRFDYLTAECVECNYEGQGREFLINPYPYVKKYRELIRLLESYRDNQELFNDAPSEQEEKYACAMDDLLSDIFKLIRSNND